MDAYLIIEEVPYGLNVDFELIALSPIAVELCEHLRLVKETPAKVCIISLSSLCTSETTSCKQRHGGSTKNLFGKRLRCIRMHTKRLIKHHSSFDCTGIGITTLSTKQNWMTLQTLPLSPPPYESDAFYSTPSVTFLQWRDFNPQPPAYKAGLCHLSYIAY